MSKPRKFIVWAPSFDDSMGGVIALHVLADRLNTLGHSALLWPQARPPFRLPLTPGKLWWKLGYAARRTERNYRSPFGTPIADWADVEDAIVVYPEIVKGNPLNGRRVVRWLLHKPGFHEGPARFGEGDLFFHYQEAFQDPVYPSRRLAVTWINDTYRNWEEPHRSGSAYLLRKGKGREIMHDIADSVCVDDLTHEERAAVFNRSRIFYCYDLYTMYAAYAAACGCIPIVVPVSGLPKEEWVSDERRRYGIAYGTDDIPWAIATRDKLLERMRQIREEEDYLVRAFARICTETFAG